MWPRVTLRPPCTAGDYLLQCAMWTAQTDPTLGPAASVAFTVSAPPMALIRVKSITYDYPKPLSANLEGAVCSAAAAGDANTCFGSPANYSAVATAPQAYCKVGLHCLLFQHCAHWQAGTLQVYPAVE